MRTDQQESETGQWKEEGGLGENSALPKRHHYELLTPNPVHLTAQPVLPDWNTEHPGALPAPTKRNTVRTCPLPELREGVRGLLSMFCVSTKPHPLRPTARTARA